jgi:hypothetical protein
MGKVDSFKKCAGSALLRRPMNPSWSPLTSSASNILALSPRPRRMDQITIKTLNVVFTGVK